MLDVFLVPSKIFWDGAQWREVVGVVQKVPDLSHSEPHASAQQNEYVIESSVPILAQALACLRVVVQKTRPPGAPSSEGLNPAWLKGCSFPV